MSKYYHKSYNEFCSLPCPLPSTPSPCIFLFIYPSRAYLCKFKQYEYILIFSPFLHKRWCIIFTIIMCLFHLTICLGNYPASVYKELLSFIHFSAAYYLIVGEYSSPPLSVEDMFQDALQMPETMESTEPYTHIYTHLFPIYTHTFFF